MSQGSVEFGEMPAVHPVRQQGKDPSAFSRVRFVFSTTTKESHASQSAHPRAPAE